MSKRHPVADLLTDEMRTRVRVARFRDYGGLIAMDGHPFRCPLAVALGRSDSDIYEILQALDVSSGTPEWKAVWDFTAWADRPGHDPDDVYVMLGCAPPDGAS